MTLNSGKKIYYGHVGDPSTQCLSRCTPSVNTAPLSSPNYNRVADAMVNTLAQQYVEMITDPESDGVRSWQDTPNGYEAGDKCAV
jgi:Phosphate-induced protein 1 conserved region